MVRSNQSGLGTASDGVNMWGAITNGATANIVSDEASISNCVSGFPTAFLGNKTTTNINFLVRVQQSNNVNDGIGPCFRCQDANNMYFVALYENLSGLIFSKLVAGNFTNIVSGNFTLSTGTFYWIRVVMSGNHLQARVWQDGTSEPGSWLIDTTDNTYTTAGQFGMIFNVFQSSSDVVFFDHIVVTDNQTPVTNPIVTNAICYVRNGVATGYVRNGDAIANVRSGNATVFVR